MEHKDFQTWVIPLAFLGVVSESTASSWTCRNIGLTRHVSAFYPDAPAPLPRKIYDMKTTKNALPSALWEAGNKEGSCEHKVEKFIGKPRSLGWQCSSDSL